MIISSTRMACTTAAALQTAITFACRTVARVLTVVTLVIVRTPMAPDGRSARPVIALARPTVCERGPPTIVISGYVAAAVARLSSHFPLFDADLVIADAITHRSISTNTTVTSRAGRRRRT